MEKTSSQDQCASSDSVHDESCGKHGQDMKAAFFLCNPELSMNASQAEISQPIVQFPYAYTDPYFSGLYTAYGPHNMIQPHMMAVGAAASGRVPLPADLPEDGPIYVNAKQYHGILRRRQTRAKLEAQNKLVKNRKPYLHESRHQHALNRVRGSGGRFLSTKKSRDSISAPTGSDQSASGGDTSDHSYRFDRRKMDGPNSGEYSGGPLATTEGGAILQQQQDGGGFSSVGSSRMEVSMQGGDGGFVYNGNRHYVSVFR